MNNQEYERRRLIRHIWNLIDYWATVQPERSPRERLEGLAFSILTTLDGESGDMPPFGVVPLREKPNGEWTQPPRGDLGGALHEQFYAAREG